MLLIAHLSDTHLDGGERSYSRARAVMDYLTSLKRPVDALLVTGDIADNGLAAEYEQAAELFDVPYPVLTTPGNWDARGAYRKIMLGDQSPGDGPVNRATEVGGAVFLLCDSTIPGQHGGLLAEETLNWLASELASRSGQPSFVCFHHPPVMLHVPFVDQLKLAGEHRLADLHRQPPQVVAILCGHAHAAAAGTFAGRPVLVAPGIGSTLMLPWESEDLLDSSRPPSFAFHVLGDDRQLATHYRTLKWPVP
jgi:Icc protein